MKATCRSKLVYSFCYILCIFKSFIFLTSNIIKYFTLQYSNYLIACCDKCYRCPTVQTLFLWKFCLLFKFFSPRRFVSFLKQEQSEGKRVLPPTPIVDKMPGRLGLAVLPKPFKCVDLKCVMSLCLSYSKMWRNLWDNGRRIDIMSASGDEAYAPDEPIMIGISSVEICTFFFFNFLI